MLIEDNTKPAISSCANESHAGVADTPEANMPMREYINEWLTAMRQNLARTTYQTYSRINGHFLDYLDIHYPGITLGELRHNHVQEFLNYKLDEGCKASCAKQYYLAIHSALAYTHLACWQAADLCEDNRLDVVDLCMMKRKLIYG